MTVVETRVVHDWRLVAPWWHWPLTSASNPADVRTSAPVFQKYDRPDAANALLEDPQRRLAFQPDSDQVATVSPGLTAFQLPTREVGDLRKLYLDSHHRQYLVVCSLHCDAPGFPNVDRGTVCQAGFVVRRRTYGVPTGARGQGRAALKDYAAARRRRGAAEAQLAAARLAGPTSALRAGQLEARLESLVGIEAAEAKGVRDWADAVGVARELQGWKPVGAASNGVSHPTVPVCGGSTGTGGTGAATPPALTGVGRWETVSEVPEHLDEVAFPLYPLVADPTLADHDAHGETIYFGVVPTGSADVDPGGDSRFDDSAVYEIRCFVRHHRAECPIEGAQCRCPLSWSEPTEAYQLAPHFDLEGTANRPVTVQLPSLPQLQADALRLGPVGGVRLRSPKHSALNFTTDAMVPTPGAPNEQVQICSISIPLITIVATFVLHLFLPIVVFVFQLWHLLLLKCCVPVSFSVEPTLAAALEALPPSLDLDDSTATSFPDFSAAFTAATAGMKGRVGGVGPSRTPKAAIDKLVAEGDLAPAGRLALVRGLLRTSAPQTPGRTFAPRVERSQVVRP